MINQTNKPPPQRRKKNPPIRIIDAYWPVVGKLWANETPEGEVSLSATFARVYRDKDTGEYRESKNIYRDDLLKLSRAAEKTYDALRKEEQAMLVGSGPSRADEQQESFDYERRR